MPLHSVWVEDDDPEFEEGSLVITDELSTALNLDGAELLDDAEGAIRWLCGDIVAREVETLGDIEISNEEGQEIFKAALQVNAAEIPCPVEVTQAIARAFEVGEDL